MKKMFLLLLMLTFLLPLRASTNEAPIVWSFTLRHPQSTAEIDPSQPITLKKVTLRFTGMDDCAIAAMELWVNDDIIETWEPASIPDPGEPCDLPGTSGTTLKTIFGHWNAARYRGDTVTLKAVVRDSEGLQDTEEIIVTVAG